MNFLALLQLAAATQPEMVATPFGLRPRECILEVPTGSLVEEHPTQANTMMVTTVEGDVRMVDSPDVCGNPKHNFLHEPRKSFVTTMGSGPGPVGNQTCDSPPCTCDSLATGCNNWVDNAGWTQAADAAPIAGFTSEYSVPETPANTTGGPVLFYFIGAENTNGTPRQGQPPPSGRAILQPVLTYAPSSWCKNSTTGWCISSWYCCPANLTTHSPYILNVEPGDRYAAWFNLTDADTYEVVSKNTVTGVETKLSCPRQGRNFNWADVTLEIYGIHSCDEFAKGPMIFDKLKLWDTSGKTLIPEWELTTEKPCQGKITLLPNSSITVEHSSGLRV